MLKCNIKFMSDVVICLKPKMPASYKYFIDRLSSCFLQYFLTTCKYCSYEFLYAGIRIPGCYAYICSYIFL